MPELEGERPFSKRVNWVSWRERIPPDVLATIPEAGEGKAFKQVLDTAAEYREKMRSEKRKPNRLAVVIATSAGREVLPETLKEIVRQMKTINYYGDIWVVLNSGLEAEEENSFSYTGGYRPSDMETVVDKKGKLLDEIEADEVVYGRTVVQPPSGDSHKNNETQAIELEKEVFDEGNGKKIRLVIVTQKPSEENRGKLRALRDIYYNLYSLNQEKGYCPGLLLAMDDETRLRMVDAKNHMVLTDQVAGLGSLISKSKNGLKAVGSKLHLIPYDESNGNPDWDAKLAIVQKIKNFFHGMSGYEWLPGGGHVFDFRDAVAIYKTIAELLPGTRGEDIMATVMLRTFGVLTQVDERVIHTNRCPRVQNLSGVLSQLERWEANNVGIQRVVGEQLMRLVIDPSKKKVIKQLLRTVRQNPKIGFKTALLLIKNVIPGLSNQYFKENHGDDVLGGSAVWPRVG